MSKLGKFISYSVVVVVIIAGVVWWKADSLAKTAIERGTEHALGVDTRVERVSFSLFQGKFAVEKINVNNPAGFDTPFLLNINNINIMVDNKSLLTPTIKIPFIMLEGLTFNIEQSHGENNINTIINSVNSASSKEDESATQSSNSANNSSSGKRLSVDSVILENIQVRVTVDGNEPTVVNIPEVSLKNVTKDGESISTTQLIKQLMPALLAAVIKNGNGLPSEVLSSLGESMMGFAGDMPDNVKSLLNQVDADLLDRYQDDGTLTDKLDDLGDSIGDKLKNAKEKFESMF